MGDFFRPFVEVAAGALATLIGGVGWTIYTIRRNSRRIDDLQVTKVSEDKFAQTVAQIRDEMKKEHHDVVRAIDGTHAAIDGTNKRLDRLTEIMIQSSKGVKHDSN